jgi:hypothetical protein
MADHITRLAADADDAGCPLVADKLTLQCFSSCARVLPAAAEEWDLSQLLLDGQPVQRSTVVCWLNAISQQCDNKPMFTDQPDSPARTMAGLAQLLAFADAVGTQEGLLAALDAQVSAAAALVAEVQLGEQQLQLAADSCYYFAAAVCAAGGGPAVPGLQAAAAAASGGAAQLPRKQQLFLNITAQLC